MKFNSKQDRSFFLRKALYLRYGRETKDLKKDELNPPILSVAIVAKLLKIPE